MVVFCGCPGINYKKLLGVLASLADKRRTPKVSQIVLFLLNLGFSFQWQIIYFFFKAKNLFWKKKSFFVNFGGSVALNFLRRVTGLSNISPVVQSTLSIWDWWKTQVAQIELSIGKCYCIADRVVFNERNQISKVASLLMPADGKHFFDDCLLFEGNCFYCNLAGNRIIIS